MIFSGIWLRGKIKILSKSSMFYYTEVPRMVLDCIILGTFCNMEILFYVIHLDSSRV